jgi:hypothetical protein
VEAVVNRVPGPGGSSVLGTPNRPLGTVMYGGGGAQGVSAAPGALLPATVAGHLPAGADTVTATTGHGSGQLDALLLTPLLSTLVTRGNGHGVALITSVADTERRVTVEVPGTGPTVARIFDDHGRLREIVTGGAAVTVLVPGGGFAIALR